MILILQLILLGATQALALSLIVVIAYVGILLTDEVVLYIQKNRSVIYIPIVLFIQISALIYGTYVNRLDKRWSERTVSKPKYVPRHSIYFPLGGNLAITAS